VPQEAHAKPRRKRPRAARWRPARIPSAPRTAHR